MASNATLKAPVEHFGGRSSLADGSDSIMIGLFNFAITFGWLAASIFIAIWILKRLRVTRTSARWLAGVPVAIIVFLLPMSDMVIARARIEYLCRTDPLVREVRFFGTIPGYERDFYTPSGSWKSTTDRDIPVEERARLIRLSEQLLAFKSQEVIRRGLLPNAGSDTFIVERATGRLLASYRTYYMFDGLAVRMLLVGQPTTRTYCEPPDISKRYIDSRIFPFASYVEEGKR